MQKIAVIGAGGLGIEVRLLINAINKFSMKWDFMGFYDDNPEASAGQTYRDKILGNIDAVNSLENKTGIVVAIGSPEAKQKILSKLNNSKIWFPNLIHPDVFVDRSNSIGEGAIISAGSKLTANINIGNHVLINLNCTIGHDVKIGDYSSIMPGVNISGTVTVGKQVLIGTGAGILNNCLIGDNATIGAGAVVINDIENNLVVAGMPARPIK